uniref:DUF2017 domain-containing protein n=1 Tax=Echinostoma caproni TaxID=27848 RepID=A0A183BB26_9TREM
LWSNDRQDVEAPEEGGSGWSKNLDARLAQAFIVLYHLILSELEGASRGDLEG